MTAADSAGSHPSRACRVQIIQPDGGDEATLNGGGLRNVQLDL